MRFRVARGNLPVLLVNALRTAFGILSRINRYAGLLGMCALFLLALLVVADIVSRELAHHSLPGVTEIVYLGIVAVVFLSFAYTEEKGGHVKIEILPERLSPRGRAAIDVFSWLTGACLMGLLTWLAGLEAAESLRVGEYIPTAIRVPIYPVKFAVCIGFGLLGLQFLAQLVQKLIGAPPQGDKSSSGANADEGRA